LLDFFNLTIYLLLFLKLFLHLCLEKEKSGQNSVSYLCKVKRAG